MRLLLIAVIAFSIPACHHAVAATPYVAATYQPVDGCFLVSFTLRNNLWDNRISRWRLYTAQATDVIAPLAWDIHQDSRQVEWYALSETDEVQPGHSLGGFGFTIQQAPDALPWWIAAGNGYTGSVTPTLIPEPASLAALAMGLVGIGGLALRRRR